MIFLIPSFHSENNSRLGLRFFYKIRDSTHGWVYQYPWFNHKNTKRRFSLACCRVGQNRKVEI